MARSIVADAIAWDTHAHVIGDPREYPLASGRGYTPAPASLDDYLAMLDRHGIARGVLVQPSVYGHDHRCLLDALARAGGRLRGIAVPSPDATVQDLEDMHERGVRGVRCNLINPGGLSPAVVALWQPALRAMGWHVECHLPVDRRPEWTDVIESFDIPVVIDHMGRPTPGAVDPSSPPLAQLIRLVEQERCFVKLSAPYRLSPDETTRGTAHGEPRRDADGAVMVAERNRPVDRCDAARARVPRGERVSLLLGHRLAARRYGAAGRHTRRRRRARRLAWRPVDASSDHG